MSKNLGPLRYTELEDEATVKPVLNGHSKADKTDNHFFCFFCVCLKSMLNTRCHVGMIRYPNHFYA